MTEPSYDLAHWRAQIPILDHAIPMNNCSQAPQTLRTRAAANRYLDSWNGAGMDWDLWIQEVEGARAEFAKLIHAAPEEVAVFSSVSHATASVASALDLKSSRNRIVTTRGEFPTVGQIWLGFEKYGAHLSWVPVREGRVLLEDYAPVVDERTLLLSTFHGYYQTGFKQDLTALARIAHDQGALLYVDAYQTLGACPVDVKALEIDLLASGNLKFLMGIPGIAFLYVSPRVVETLHPAVTGWFGREHPFAFAVDQLDWAPNARRFDTGTPPVINAYVARAGMEIINEIGAGAIQSWTEQLSARLVEGGEARGLTVLGPKEAEERTPATAFLCPGDDGAGAVSHAVERRMAERGIIASARGPALRLAPHFYSTFEDVDRALDILAESVRESEQGALH